MEVLISNNNDFFNKTDAERRQMILANLRENTCNVEWSLNSDDIEFIEIPQQNRNQIAHVSGYWKGGKYSE